MSCNCSLLILMSLLHQKQRLWKVDLIVEVITGIVFHIFTDFAIKFHDTGSFYFYSSVFVQIAANASISACPSYFVVINHKMINHLPRSIHKAYILSLIWQRISLKPTKIVHFLVNPCNKSWAENAKVLSEIFWHCRGLHVTHLNFPFLSWWTFKIN